MENTALSTATDFHADIPPTSPEPSDPSGLLDEGRTPALSAYRAGVGVGYAAALLDMREASAHGYVNTRVVFLRLMAHLIERCDQIAEAQP